jgi:hypothetical protein
MILQSSASAAGLAEWYHYHALFQEHTLFSPPCPGVVSPMYGRYNAFYAFPTLAITDDIRAFYRSR